MVNTGDFSRRMVQFLEIRVQTRVTQNKGREVLMTARMRKRRNPQLRVNQKMKFT